MTSSNEKTTTNHERESDAKPHVHGPHCNHGHHHHHHDNTPFVRATPKVGANDPCPCGSGKKHKKCCRA